MHNTDVFACIFMQFYNNFKGYAYNHFTIYNEDVIHDAFTDGILELYSKMTSYAYDERGVAAETLIIGFCRKKLLAALRKTSIGNKTDYLQPADLQETTIVEDDFTIVDDYLKEMSNKEEAANQALQQIGERCRQLLTWRKGHKVDKGEIARRLAISINTVDNAVYECFKKVKEKFDNILSNMYNNAG